MLVVETPQSMAHHSGQDLGVTDWVTVGQDQIDAYAELTGDDHWIHVDVARAAQESPGGKTIAHGLYVLSLIPRLQRQLFRIERRGAGLNYGYDRVRFTAPVPVGARLRLRQVVGQVSAQGQSARIALTSIIEIEHGAKPALVADGILMIAEC